MNDLRPLRLGELIDRSASFWRGHWRPLFWLAVGFQLVQFILFKVNDVVSRRVFPALTGDLAAMAKDQPGEAAFQLAAGLGLLTLVALGALFVSQVGGVATTHYVYSRLLQRPGPELRASVELALKKLGVTFWAFLLSVGWTLVVGLLFLLPGAVLFGGGLALLSNEYRGPGLALLILGGAGLVVGSVGLLLWFLIRFLLIAQVVALEDVGPLGVFRRTDALSSGRVAPGPTGLVKARLMVLVTVIGALLVVVGLVASLPVLALGWVFGASFQAGQTVNELVPQALLVPAQLVQVVLGSVFAPLYVVFQVGFYVDMRVRREGLDLELKLAAS
ncbi:MAG: hypothetical protein IT380_14290 [Myxococcales bacterium]|nr:hypothetical protein [Myxococcales bacterium]